MDEIDYDEIVTLLMPGDDSRTMSLADAVRLVLRTDDRVKRIAATILTERESIGFKQLNQIYNRPDFPRRP